MANYLVSLNKENYEKFKKLSDTKGIKISSCINEALKNIDTEAVNVVLSVPKQEIQKGEEAISNWIKCREKAIIDLLKKEKV